MRKIDPTTRVVLVDGKQLAVTAKDVVYFERIVAAYRVADGFRSETPVEA